MLVLRLAVSLAILWSRSFTLCVGRTVCYTEDLMASGVVTGDAIVELRFGVAVAPRFGVANLALQCVNTTTKALDSDLDVNVLPPVRHRCRQIC